MFERFTDNAKKVLTAAEAVARDAHSPFVRRHHVLLALLDDARSRPDGITASMLADAGIEAESFAAALHASLTNSEEPVAESSLKFSVETKKALELALREALSLGHNYIGCEHLLLSILRAADGPLATTIGATNLRYGTAREFLRASGVGRRGGWRFGRSPVVGPMRRTDAAEAVIRAAQMRAGERPMTTGDLIVALAETKGTHFSRLIDPVPQDLVGKADQLIADRVVDGEPEPVRVDPRTGAFTVADPELAAKIRTLPADKIAAALRTLVDNE